MPAVLARAVLTSPKNRKPPMQPSDRLLKDLARSLTAVAAGQPTEPLAKPPGTCDETGALIDAVNLLIANLKVLREFSTALANGSVDYEVPPRMHLIDSLKSLQSSLKHLTWQTQEVAAGNFNQRVDFLGDFSVAFNKMVDALREKQEADRSAAAANAEFLAHHDGLTLLPNRLLVVHQFSQAIACASSDHSTVVLMLLDLDNFKTINDVLGPSIGDELLKAAAARLAECVRGKDLLARSGGDEFMILMTGMTCQGAITALPERILEALSKPLAIGGLDLVTSASIGIAVYPSDGEDFETLFKSADTAMYQAKRAGRNTYRFFDRRMNDGMDERLELRNNLWSALERGEFELYYQPQIDAGTGAIMGAEALLRWNHRRLGLVLPARFIPIAEDSGAIVDIGKWVLDEACRQASLWHQNGLPDMAVAVNLSAAQLKRDDIEQTVLSALCESGLAPHNLELELTETMLVEDRDSVLQTIRRLKAVGVALAIDDFGTGYSCLAYLKRFAVDRVKIDRAFVRDVETAAHDAAIVRAIVQMAQGMGLKTIAEGVENEGQLNYLQACGCEAVQGYYFGRPMPAAQFEDYCRRVHAA